MRGSAEGGLLLVATTITGDTRRATATNVADRLDSPTAFDARA